MKYLPSRTGLRALLAAAAIPLSFIGVASLPWHGDRPPAPPRVIAAARGSGPLAAGAAEVRFVVPPGAPIGGFARFAYASDGEARPVGARALVLSSPGCKVALVSAEILLVPERLDAAVRARVADLGLSGLLLAATHTHAGPGGYWRFALGERLATGSYDPRMEEAIVSAIADAVRRAAGALVPARVSVAHGAAEELARSRSGGLRDGSLTAIRLERLDGAPLAEVAIFAAHPTILGKSNHVISGDWPAPFLASGAHGLRLLVQGAIGDQSVAGPASSSVDSFARALSGHVDALRFGAPDPSPALSFAAVEVALPAPDPGAVPAPLRRAARSLAYGAFPATASVQALRIGPMLLVAVPGEPVAQVAAGWRGELPSGASIVSLTGGYIGYVEAPERVAAGAGEAVRTEYGPELAARLGAGVRAAAAAAGR